MQAPRAADCYASAGSPGISQERDRRSDFRMMTPESRSDQSCGGYAGLQRIGVNGLSPSNNAMEILSRFRPIAPKPTTAKAGESAGSAPSDPPSTSTLSFDRTSSGKAVTSERSRMKRSRKRTGADPLLPPTRRPKRGQTPSRPRVVSCDNGPATAVGGIQKAVEQFAPDKNNFGLQPMPPTANGGGDYRPIKGIAPNASTELAPSSEYTSMGDALEGFGGWAARLDRRKFQGFGAFKMPPASNSNEWAALRGTHSQQDAGAAATPASEGGGMVAADEPPAFRGRAVPSSLPYVGRESDGVQKMKGGYDRGYVVYQNQKCGAENDAYRAEAQAMGRSWPFPMYGVAPNTQWVVDQLSHARSNGDHSEVISDANSREPNAPEALRPLVTLALLPRDSPSQRNTTSSAPIRPTASKHIPCLELSLAPDTRDWNEIRTESPEELHKLTLFNHRSYEEERRSGFRGGSDRSGGTSSSSEKDLRAGRMVQEEPLEALTRMPSWDSEGSGVSLTDTIHMEQQYSGSSEPMLLSDDASGEILWANQAYMKADAERNQRLCKVKEGPYLDVLGIPTNMSSFNFRSPGGAVSKANLWGFLKKFMKSGPSRDSSPSPLEGGGADGSVDIGSPDERQPSPAAAAAGEDFRDHPLD